MQPNMQQRTTLDLPRIAAWLGGGRASVDYYPEVDSTMRVACNLGVRSEFGSGSMVLADAQSAGRGRLGRTWEAPFGTSLLVSLILKQSHLMCNHSMLPLIAGLAVQSALAKLALPGVEVGIKWPNDILLRAADGVERKVAGVLVESTVEQQGLAGHAVIGFGINVLQSAAELPQVEPPAPPPTSLWLASGIVVDRTALLLDLWAEFFTALDSQFKKGRRSAEQIIVGAWRDVSWTLGRPVTVHHADGTTLHGTAVDVVEERVGIGALIVEDGAGVRHRVHSGDVSLHAG